jgi:hypothetical protein
MAAQPYDRHAPTRQRQTLGASGLDEFAGRLVVRQLVAVTQERTPGAARWYWQHGMRADRACSPDHAPTIPGEEKGHNAEREILRRL